MDDEAGIRRSGAGSWSGRYGCVEADTSSRDRILRTTKVLRRLWDVRLPGDIAST